MLITNRLGVAFNEKLYPDFYDWIKNVDKKYPGYEFDLVTLSALTQEANVYKHGEHLGTMRTFLDNVATYYLVGPSFNKLVQRVTLRGYQRSNELVTTKSKFAVGLVGKNLIPIPEADIRRSLISKVFSQYYKIALHYENLLKNTSDTFSRNLYRKGVVFPSSDINSDTRWLGLCHAVSMALQNKIDVKEYIRNNCDAVAFVESLDSFTNYTAISKYVYVKGVMVENLPRNEYVRVYDMTNAANRTCRPELVRKGGMMFGHSRVLYSDKNLLPPKIIHCITTLASFGVQQPILGMGVAVDDNLYYIEDDALTQEV